MGMPSRKNKRGREFNKDMYMTHSKAGTIILFILYFIFQHFILYKAVSCVFPHNYAMRQAGQIILSTLN